MDISIERTLEQFVSALRLYVAQEGITYRAVSKPLSLRPWHIYQFLKNKNYAPSIEVKRKCRIKTRKTPPRVIVYTTTCDDDYMEKKAVELERLTNGEYTIRRTDDFRRKTYEIGSNGK